MNPILCTVVIMDDIANMTDETKLCASLSGLWVMSRTLLNSNGHRGTVLAHKNYFKMQKQCMMTEQFKEKHPRIANLIEAALRVGKPRCKTTLRAPQQEDALVQRARNHESANNQLLFLVCREEKNRFTKCKHVMNMSRLLGEVYKTEPELCITGLGCN